MEKKEKILKYIKDKYNPISIFVYGSFNKGTNNQNSDFDSLIIGPDDILLSLQQRNFFRQQIFFSRQQNF